MADTKISALAAIAAIAGEDLIAAIDDPGGTPASKKATITQVEAFLIANTATLTNKTFDLGDNTLTGTTAEFNTANQDQDFATLAGTETLTNKTIDDDNNTISNIVNASIKAAAGIELSKLAAITFTERIPLVMEVPEGTVGYPDIHALGTAGAKISGMVLPDGASNSIINFKCNVPEDLAATPAASIKFYIMTQSAETSAAINLVVETGAYADGENMDAALTAETDADVTMPAGTETLDIYDQDMTTDPTAGDILLVQLTRRPADANDTYAGDPIIVGAYLEIDRTIT